MALVISRADWGADKGPGPRITTPVSLLFAHHTVTGMDIGPSAGLATEKAHMRFLEDVRGFSIGVPYNHCIFQSGRVYEGQGWGRMGAHTCNTDLSRCWNTVSHGVAFIGNYETQRLTGAQIESFQKLMAQGKERGFHTRNVTVDPHRKVKATACPGADVMRNLDRLREEFEEMDKADVKRFVAEFLGVLPENLSDVGDSAMGLKAFAIGDRPSRPNRQAVYDALVANKGPKGDKGDTGPQGPPGDTHTHGANREVAGPVGPVDG
jgi:hypothetical protein